MEQIKKEIFKDLTDLEVVVLIHELRQYPEDKEWVEAGMEVVKERAEALRERNIEISSKEIHSD